MENGEDFLIRHDDARFWRRARAPAARASRSASEIQKSAMQSSILEQTPSPAMSRSAAAARAPGISQCALVAMVSLFAPMKSCAMVPTPVAPAVSHAGMTRTAIRCLRTRPFSALSASSSPRASEDILDQVETTLANVFAAYGISNGSNFGTAEILSLPSHQREAVGVATNLKRRIDAMGRSNDCRTCWLQRKHCICSQCPPCETLPKINRLFLLTHHKEVGMVVDTAKLLLSTFPNKSRLVVAGIGREHQPAMDEMLDAVDGGSTNDHSKKSKCLVLFPSEDALAFAEIEEKAKNTALEADDESNCDVYDVVVIDGTWSQARKMYNRYIPSEEDGGPQRVQLSDDAVATLNGDNVESGAKPADAYWYDNEDNQRISGHQLRRHPTKWREIATCEATRLLLRDMMAGDFTSSDENVVTPWGALAKYQNVANAAALRQIGPPRVAPS